jgi:hypothetical protein
MRYPVAPAEGATNLFLVVGSYQPQGDMSTGTVYVSTDDGATWASHGLKFDSGEDGGDKFWACNVDISALEAGDTLQYAIEVDFTDKDTTYLGTTNQLDGVKYATLAAAKENPYEVAIGGAPVQPIASTVWHVPADTPADWTEPMRNPLAPAEGDANVAIFIGNYQADTAGANMTTGAVYWRKGSTGEFTQAAVGFKDEKRNDFNDGWLKFWGADIDTSAFAEGDTLEYYCRADVEGFAPTFIGTTNAGAGNALFAAEAEAASNAFSVVFGEEVARPLAEHVWHKPAECPSGADTWSTPMRNPLALTEGVTNVAVFVGTYEADSDGENMTGGKIFYAINGGAFVSTNLAWSDSDMRNAMNDGWLKFWKYDIDTSAVSEGGTLAYYFVANVEGRAPTYIISDGADGCVLTNAVDPETDALFTATCGERVYDLGNCWHVPGNYEPWTGSMMREKLYPFAGDAVCFFVGNQATGAEGTPGNMTGGWLYHKGAGETAWSSNELAFENPEWDNPSWKGAGDNKYWKVVLPAGMYPAATNVQYYFKVEYLSAEGLSPARDTTWLASDGSGAMYKTYASEAEAQAKPFDCPFVDDSGAEPGYLWHAGNAVAAGTNMVQFWVKVGYTNETQEWADHVEMHYRFLGDGEEPAESSARISSRSRMRAASRSMADDGPAYETVAFSRDHVEEDSSSYGNATWWMGTVKSDAFLSTNWMEYEIVAWKSAESGGNGVARYADYRTSSATNRFYYTMWAAGANELTVNGLNADYTTSKFFIDEAAIAAGTETAPVISVVYAPPVENAYAVEVFSNVGRRDYWKADIDGNGIPDAIFPPNGDLYTTEVTNGYYLAQAMDRVGGKYTLTIPLEKTGAYRLTARYKATAADTWHYYSESGSGIRDHAVVVSPKKVLAQNVYELNALTVKASGASRSGRSTFADLVNPSAGKQDTFDEFSIDYLNKIGANCLWFQPIHPATEDGINFDEGPGSPYAAKDYFAVARWFGKDETEATALSEFRDFVAACDLGYCAAVTNRGYVGTINIMLDGVFNHTSWDAVLGERGVAMFAAKGITTYNDKNGRPQAITADTPIGHVRPNWYAYWQNYGQPATKFWSPTDHDVATAPDRGDFGKWGDTAELFYGRYAALVEHNDEDNGNYLDESDWFDWSCMTNEGYATAELWEYMGSYVEFWLDKTGHDFVNDRLGQLDENGAAYDDYGIDGLRCDFGQGLPPQFWEYCINRARSKKWNFMFMAESLDGGVVSYRSNRHFDILNENFVFQSTAAGTPAALQNVVESRKSLYNGGSVLLNQTSHDEIMPYDDPWVTASRHAVNSSFMGLPMMFNGQEQGIVPLRGVDTTGQAEGWKAPGSVLSGFSWHELNFGKLVPHFKSWNKLRIWDEPPSSVWASGAAEPEKESRYMAQWYGRINSARLRSPALRSGNQYYLGRYGYVVENDWQYGGTYDNNSIFAVAKYEETGAADKGKDAVLAFARFMNAGDAHYAASETYAITDEVAALLGISRGKSYTARNLAATVAEDVVWTKTGDEILDEGIWVNLSTGDGSNMYDDGALAQYLKIELASAIVFGDETNAVCGTATNLSLAITDAAGYGIAATANGEAFADFAYDATAGAIAYTPSVAGTFVFTATATNAAGNVATASATVTVAKGTPEVTAPTGLAGEVGKTLGDVTFGDARFAWAATEDTTTPFAATGTVTAAWTYTPDDTNNWNTVDGTSDVEVGKGTPEFVALTGLAGTYGTTLTLADVEGLPEGYAWADATTTIAGAGTTSYPATYNPDPDNWFDATGELAVEIAKGTPVVEPPTGLTSEVGKTLADVALPAGFAWKEPATVFTAAGTVSADWTYTPEDTANWNTVDGSSEVVVTGEEPEPAIHPRTTGIAIDADAGTVTLAVEDYPDEVAGNIWCTGNLLPGNEWSPCTGAVTTNAPGSYTIALPDPLPAMQFYSVGTHPTP